MADKNIGFIINESSSDAIEFKMVEDNKDRVIAEGVIQTAEQVNRNKRCYARNDLAKEIKGDRTKELLTTGNLKGEAGHPQSKELVRQSVIDPKLVQVQYLKLWMDGNDVKAWFRGTNNELGESFDKDLRNGEKPSFSLRALGSIENQGGKAYVRNLKIITWDRVYYPSHPTAYMSKLITEGAVDDLYRFNVPSIVHEFGNEQIVEPGFQLITPFTNASVKNYIMQESANMKTILDNFDVFYQSISLNESGNMVSLVDKDYNTICVPMERYVQNEIMNYCLGR